MPQNIYTKRKVEFESLETRIPLAADLSINVSINGRDASSIPIDIAIGTDLDFVYEVRNTGDKGVGNLTICDDAGTLSQSDDFAPAPVTTSGRGIGELGDLLATFENLKALRFIQHPHKPLMYASVTSHDSIAVINTETLELEVLIPVGTTPYGMAITDDGSKLYVANSTANYISVLNTETLKVESKVFVKDSPLDVEIARDGSLFVLSHRALIRIDPATGRELENFSITVYGGELAINAAKNRLYYANYGFTPASLFVFDLTTKPAKLLWASPREYGGESGQDLALSHDGSFISYAAGYGQLGYRIAKYNTSSMAIEGTFDTGPYPQEITFSPDDTVAYTVNVESAISTWDTNLFASRGVFRIEGKANELFVDRTGRYLFAAFDNEIRVYSTGRSVGIQMNVGDTNGNGDLDPGEAWRFESSTKAGTGRHVHRIAVGGTGSDGKITVASSMAAYFGLLSAKVKEKVMGVEAINIPGTPIGKPDDDRFEVVNGMLRTKLTEHLDASVDHNIHIRLLDEATQEVLHIVDLVVQEDSIPWHNQVDPLDVSEDGILTPLDALLVVNYLNLHNAHKLEGLPIGIAPQIDCNADGSVSPLDVLLVVNALNRRGEGEYQGYVDKQQLAEHKTLTLENYLFLLTDSWSSWPGSEWERNKGRRQ